MCVCRVFCNGDDDNDDNSNHDDENVDDVATEHSNNMLLFPDLFPRLCRSHQNVMYELLGFTLKRNGNKIIERITQYVPTTKLICHMKINEIASTLVQTQSTGSNLINFFFVWNDVRRIGVQKKKCLQNP